MKTIGTLTAILLSVASVYALPLYQNALIQLPCPPISILDLDSDGNLDLVLCGGDARLGDGRGNFPTPFTLPADGCTLAKDLNGDGKVDLICAGDPVKILFGDGAGHYSPPSPLALSGEPISGDYDADGIADIATPAGFLSLGEGNGNFGPPVAFGVTGISLRSGDFNGDHRDDLLVVPPNSIEKRPLLLLLSLGGGQFVSKPLPTPILIALEDVRVGDADNDGLTDIVFGMSEQTLAFIRGTPGEFQLERFTYYSIRTKLVLADMNGDGNLDITHASPYRTGGVLLGDGHGHFATSVGITIRTAPDLALLHGDLNGDGKQDLVSAPIYYSLRQTPVAILLSTEDGTFGTHLLKNEVGFPVAVGDVDLDGLADIVFAHPKEPYLTLFLNRNQGEFTARVLSSDRVVKSAKLEDMDADKILDLIVLDDVGITVFRGLGKGEFAEPSNSPIPAQQGLLTLKANRDNLPDILVYSGHVVCTFLTGNGLVLQGPICTDVSPAFNQAKAGDLDGDGVADLVIHVSDFWNGDIIYTLHGLGQGAFSSPLPYSRDAFSFAIGDFNNDSVDEIIEEYREGGLAAKDFNGDGYTDLLSCYCAYQDCIRFQNDLSLGSGSGFSEGLSFHETSFSCIDQDVEQAFLPGDFNGDGGKDLLVTNDWSGNNLLMLNQQPPAGHPPIAQVGSARELECASTRGADVVLDAAASFDPDSTPGTEDDISTYSWYEDLGLPTMRFLGEGKTRNVTLPLGSHHITLLVKDNSGRLDTDQTAVAVVDRTPPRLELGTNPSILWPPDHRLVPVHATAITQDACGSVELVLLEILSSEPESGSPDIADAAFGTADFVFRLRAERRGDGKGRSYHVRYRALDRAGNSTIAERVVTVPFSLAVGKSR